jgi:Tfp pilus assembly protein PilF
VKTVWIAALFALLAAAVFGRTLTYPFVTWDDDVQVTRNPRVQEPGLHRWMEILDPTESLSGKRTEYAPVREAAYRATRIVLGPAPGAFHLLSVLLHLCAALSLFAFLRCLPLDRRLVWIASLLYLVHPLQVETVAWVSGMKDSLAAACIFLGLRAETKWREHPFLSGAMSLLLLGLALGVKGTSVVWLPLAVWTWFQFDGRDFKRRLAIWLPHFFLTAGSAYLTMQVALANGIVKPFLEGSPVSTFLTMVKVLALYFVKLVVPFGLSAHYKPIPILSPLDPVFLGSALLVLAVCASAWFLRKRIPLLPFGLVWFFICMLPTLNLVPASQQAADRYTYVGLAGFALVLAHLLASQITRPRLALWVPVIVLSIYASVSFARVGVWSGSRVLWEDAARKAPVDTIAWNNYGAALVEEGKLTEGTAVFLYLVSVAPWKAEAWNNLARTRLLRYRESHNRELLSSAEIEAKKAVGLKSDYASAWNNLGLILWETGLAERNSRTLHEAVGAFDRALAADPAYSAAQRNKTALLEQIPGKLRSPGSTN